LLGCLALAASLPVVSVIGGVIVVGLGAAVFLVRKHAG
jgi:hypothetical protein